MWQKLGSREKYLLGILLVILVLFAFYRFLAQPQAAHYLELKNRLNEARVQVSVAGQKVAMLQTEKQLAETSKARYGKVMALFAGSMQDGGAVINLGLGSAACGVKIAAFKPGKITGHPHYLEMPAEMEVRGNYLGIISFLENLENNLAIPNLVNLTALSIEPAKTKAAAAGVLLPAPLPTPSAAGTPPGEMETGVTAKMSLVFYSEPTPEGRLALKQVAEWKVGRQNLFRPAEMVSPYQGVKPMGITSVEQEVYSP